MKRRLVLPLVLVVMFSVAILGILDRRQHVESLAMRTDDQAVPKVALVSPAPAPAARTLTLPGDVHAWYQAPIYAQVSGYVRMWYRDFGARVKRGELLATIDTPDLDQQLREAEAQLDVAKARYELARVTAERWKKLAGTQAVSEQEVDVNIANARAQAAEVEAARDNVGRYQAQESFKQVVAPFDGIVTSRQTDVGNYVNAAGGNAGSRGTATELFSVADLHRMRVFVSVPQDDSAYLKPGLTATVTFPQFQNRVFKASFETTANAYNMQSRTVLTELVVDNPDGLIWPGAYAEVHFRVPTPKGILLVPTQALLFRAEGLQVALVGADSRVHLKHVSVGLDLGTRVQIVDGLDARDRLIANPSQGLLDGERVAVVDVAAADAGTTVADAQPAATE